MVRVVSKLNWILEVGLSIVKKRGFVMLFDVVTHSYSI